ncbi:MAG: GIN domain-containing protein [Bacteroidales bacterium]
MRIIKKILVIIVSFFALQYIFASCNCVQSDGECRKEIRSLPNLKGLKVCVPAQIKLYQSDTCFFEISAPPKLLSHLIFRLDKGIFEIYSDRYICDSDIDISVYSSELESVTAQNGAVVESVNYVNSSQEVRIIVKDEALVDLELQSDKVEVVNQDCGVLILKGKTNFFEITSSGLAKVVASNLKAKNIEIQHGCSMGCYEYYDEVTHLYRPGQGNIYFKGRPVVTK